MKYLALRNTQKQMQSLISRKSQSGWGYSLLVEYFFIISLITNPNQINNKKEREAEGKGVREGGRKREKKRGRKERRNLHSYKGTRCVSEKL